METALCSGPAVEMVEKIDCGASMSFSSWSPRPASTGL